MKRILPASFYNLVTLTGAAIAAMSRKNSDLVTRL